MRLPGSVIAVATIGAAALCAVPERVADGAPPQRPATAAPRGRAEVPAGVRGAAARRPARAASGALAGAHLAAARGGLAKPAARRAALASRHFGVARVRPGGSVALRRAPAGAPVARAGARTAFGSPTHLAVARRKGRWLGVDTSAAPNGKLAWIDGGSPAVARAATAVSIHVDLAKLVLTVRDGGRTVYRATVGSGAPSSPTPTGRFAVTDKLPGARFSPGYGCCVLVLSGRQDRLPPAWRGGDRLAIHGTDRPPTIGERATAGCLHARDRDLRYLMRHVPLGAPVFIER